MLAQIGVRGWGRGDAPQPGVPVAIIAVIVL